MGTIGTAHGRYAAHLHFEMRKNLQVGMNRSQFPRDFSVYYSPRQFMATRGTLRGGSMVSIAIDTFGKYAGSGASPDKVAEANGPTREIPTRESTATSRAEEIKKKMDQLEQLVEKNKKNADALTDEDIDGFWDRLKTRLKNGKGTTSGEGQKP